MKKRVFLLLFLSFILCGCSAEINIDLDADYVSEDITIFADANSELEKEELNSSFRKYMPAFNEQIVADTEPDVKVSGIDYYDQTAEDTEYGIKYNYKYKFNFKDYNGSKLLKRSFRSAYIENDTYEKVIKFYTDNQGILLMDQYYSLSNVVVNIKTSLPLIETNADSFENGVYTWNFNRDNYKRNIYLKLSSESNPTKKEDKKKEDKKETDRKKQDDSKTGPKIVIEDDDVITLERVKYEPTEEEKKQSALLWLIIPLAIIGFLVIVVIINSIGKSR